ncbi:MAG: hypothetical protein C0592_01160 [Marinilabiliales bacterium]|nr:MAG: hypothetical protein C0592_01160 [Marinilabiliales bacterium]
MKKLLILVPFLWLTFSGFAQKKPTAQFDKKVHDYGVIKEEDGPAKSIFTVTNIGDDTLRITGVRPSCGCTASNYTKEGIPPGGKGTIEAIYNPANRPGNFNKAVTVTLNDPDNATVVLSIKGKVTPKPKTKADFYPNKLGNLRFKTNHLALQEIKDTEVKQDTFWLYNESKTAINIKFNNLPEHIKVVIKDPVMQPDMESFIAITYDAGAKKDYGYVFDKFFLSTDDTEQPEKLLYVSANIVQDFSWMTEKQLKKAAHIEFETETFDFGTVKSGDKVEYSFVYTNTGKSTLKILKTKASCGCTATEPTALELKKKKSGEIKIVFNTSGRKGKQHKTVTVITNDPDKPVVVLHIQGEVN